MKSRKRPSLEPNPRLRSSAKDWKERSEKPWQQLKQSPYCLRMQAPARLTGSLP